MAPVPVAVSVGKWHMSTETLRWTFKVREGTNQYVVDVAGVRTREDLISLMTRIMGVNIDEVSFSAMNMSLWRAYPPREQLCVPPVLIRDDEDVALFMRFRASQPLTKLFVTLDPPPPEDGNHPEYGDVVHQNWFTID